MQEGTLESYWFISCVLKKHVTGMHLKILGKILTNEKKLLVIVQSTFQNEQQKASFMSINSAAKMKTPIK